MGYRRDEVLGKKFTEFLTPESRHYAETVAIPKGLQTGVCKNVHYQFVTKRGTIIDTLFSAVGEKDELGGYLRGYAVLVDVTEYYRKKKELAAADNLRQELADRAILTTMLQASDGDRSPSK